MAEQTDSAGADAGATTPASEAGAAETTSTAIEQPQTSPFESPWDSIVKDEGGEPSNEGPETPAKSETEEPAKEPEKKAEAETPSTKEELDPETEVLTELFDPNKAAEPEKEEDPLSEAALDKQDPKVMADAQRNKTAKLYLERTEKLATPIKDYRNNTDVTPEQFLEKLEPVIGAEKVTALRQAAAHSLVDANPEAAFRRAIAVHALRQNPNLDISTFEYPSLDTVLSGKPAETAGGETDPAAIAEIVKGLTETGVDWDWRDPANDDKFTDDRERAMAAAIRELEKLKTPAPAAEKAEEAKETETPEQQAQQRLLHRELMDRVKDYRTSLEGKLLPFIAKNTGLEASSEDVPEVAAVKSQLMQLYKGTEYERANNIDSRFESFAYNESTVKKDLVETVTRLVDVQTKEAAAILAGDTAKAAEFHAQAEEERVPLFTYFAKANDEFKAAHVMPFLKAFELTGQLAVPRKEAAARVEVTGNGAGKNEAPPMEARTAGDVWDNAIKKAETEDQLERAG